jgi:hypothetical protein
MQRTPPGAGTRYGPFIEAALPPQANTRMIAMLRKTLLAATLAVGALVAATTGSQAGYGHGYGYGHGGYNYGYSYRYQPHYDYSSYYSCRTISFRVWDEYSYQYVYRTKQICG